MVPGIIAITMVAYFALLMTISFVTGRKANSNSFYVGNRQSPWYIVAFGMLGASLSGVTFISVPGWVASTQFTYLQMVMGYAFGYIFIAYVLLPVYYRLNLTSIYTYLDRRFGKNSHLAGASFFLLSRTIGSSFRLFLVANVLHIIVFQHWNIPFVVSVFITLALIYLYTFRGGIKTIIWTDTFQTLMMLTALVVTIVGLGKALDWGFTDMVRGVAQSEYSKIWVWENWSAENHFLKHFLSGMFVTIAMTGLDQDMMQKNLSCRNLKDAQKNMKWYGFAFIPVNLLFLSLGVLLMIYAQQTNFQLPDRSDNIFPMIATSGNLGMVTTIFFILGLVAAAYSSADSAVTSLTTSFTVDILKVKESDEVRSKKTRLWVHMMFSFLLFVVIMVFNQINDESVIKSIFTVAGYTYGPLLGIYFIGLFTRLAPNDKLAPVVMIIAPFVAYAIKWLAKAIWDYNIGFELLLINGALTAIGLALIHRPDRQAV